MSTYHFITIVPMFITFLWGSMITYQWVFGRIYYALNQEVNCAFLFYSMMPIYLVPFHHFLCLSEFFVLFCAILGRNLTMFV